MTLASERKIQKVLVTEVSRLGRRTSEVLQAIETLTDLGVSVYVHTYSLETLTPKGKRNPTASLLFTLLAEFARANAKPSSNASIAVFRKHDARERNLDDPRDHKNPPRLFSRSTVPSWSVSEKGILSAMRPKSPGSAPPPYRNASTCSPPPDTLPHTLR